MSHLVALKSTKLDVDGALTVLDRLRAQIMSGQAIAFAAVTIEADDSVQGWSGATRPVSQLRLLGAVARLQSAVAGGEMLE